MCFGVYFFSDFWFFVLGFFCLLFCLFVLVFGGEVFVLVFLDTTKSVANKSTRENISLMCV